MKNVIKELEQNDEDMFMRLFVQPFTDDAIEWYRGLPHGAISCRHGFFDLFIKQFGDHSDKSFASHELTNIKKNSNETVTELNKRFNKFLNKIHKDM